MRLNSAANCETDFVAKSPEFVSFTKDLAMHIAAANPRYLRREDVPAEMLEQERQILRTQAQNLNKPEKVMEKIVEGSGLKNSIQSFAFWSNPL